MRMRVVIAPVHAVVALGFVFIAVAGVAVTPAIAGNSWGPSSHGIFIAEPTPDDIYVHTSNGYRFDPLAGEPALPAQLTASAPSAGEKGYFLVQGHTPLSPDFAEMLRAAGAEPLSFLSRSAYVVRATPSVSQALARNAAVRWVGFYQPAYKLSRHLAGTAGAKEAVVIKVFEGASADEVRAKLESLGAVIRDVTVTEWNRIIRCSIDGAAETNAARIAEIEWIEPDFPAVSDNDRDQWVIQTQVSSDRRIWDMGITGTGQVVAMHDTGVRTDHCAFVDPAVPIVAAGDYPTHRKIIAYKIVGGGVFGDAGIGHGTHTSGTSVGDDGVSSPYDGMAKGAKLYFCDFGNSSGGLSIPGDLNPMFQLSYTGNGGGAARIGSNSWGQSSSFGVYSVFSQQTDQFMWNHKDFLLFFSDGNDGPGVGEVHPPATAKDCVSGGGTGNGVGATSIYASTSRGPTDDGRFKPTICAPATLVSANFSGTCTTQTLAGTSMSTPSLAGGTALIRQYLADGFYPSGTATPADALSPSAALLKSVAINCAAPNVFPAFTVPGNDIGWGRMLLDNALYFPGDAIHLLLSDQTTGLSTGAFDNFSWVVIDPLVPMKVSLVWTDYMGNAAAFTQIVNNLNLTVTEPNGTTQYLGNVYSGGESVTGGSVDNLNVEECVRRNTPTLGIWTARISAASTPQGPQPYALVVTGGVIPVLTSVDEGATPVGRDGTKLLASAGPNPIVRGDAGTVIRYYLPRDGQVKLGIFDVNGREVRRLVATHQLAGQQAAAWDAKDASGRAVPSGIYFYRLETSSGRLSDKVVISR